MTGSHPPANKIKHIPNLAMTKLFLEPMQKNADAMEASFGKAKGDFLRKMNAAYFETLLKVMAEEGVVFAEWVDDEEYTIRPAPVHEMDDEEPFEDPPPLLDHSHDIEILKRQPVNRATTDIDFVFRCGCGMDEEGPFIDAMRKQFGWNVRSRGRWESTYDPATGEWEFRCAVATASLWGWQE